VKEHCLTVEWGEQTLVSQPDRGKGTPVEMGVGKAGGMDGSIDARHPGQIYLELWKKGPDGRSRVVEIKDLRAV